MTTNWYLLRDSSTIERFVKLLESFSAETLSKTQPYCKGNASKNLSIVKHEYQNN